MISRKRKETSEVDNNDVGDSSHNKDQEMIDAMKKVRIAQSPGEIRLEKELEQLGSQEQSIGYSVQRTLNKSVILINVSMNASPTPINCTFRVFIPKYYPHNCPLITIEGSSASMMISDGKGKYIPTDLGGAHISETSTHVLLGLDTTKLCQFFTLEGNMHQNCSLINLWNAMNSIYFIIQNLQNVINECRIQP